MLEGLGQAVGVAVAHGRFFAAVSAHPGVAEAARVLGEIDPCLYPAPLVTVVPAGEEGLTDLAVLEHAVPRRVVVVDVVAKTVAYRAKDGSVTVRPFSRAALSDAALTAPFHTTVVMVHPDAEHLTDECVVLAQDYVTVLVARSTLAAWALNAHGHMGEGRAEVRGTKRGLWGKLRGR